MSNSNEEQHPSVYSEKSLRLIFARRKYSSRLFFLISKAETRGKHARAFATKIQNKNHIALLMFGMKKSLTFVGLLAITGANAGAVDLTEGDFDAQVFESGKVRCANRFDDEKTRVFLIEHFSSKISPR